MYLFVIVTKEELLGMPAWMTSWTGFVPCLPSGRPSMTKQIGEPEKNQGYNEMNMPLLAIILFLYHQFMMLNLSFGDQMRTG